jgi:ribosomal protein S18 acetylase RimI-like enzyme
MGTGVASDLMRAALDGARSRFQATSVWLGTNNDNARAQAFYGKHGFRVVGQRTFSVGGQMHDDVVMQHEL